MSNFVIAMCLLYNLALLTGCSYLVFWKGHSGWWFLLVLILLVNPKTAVG